MNPSRVSLPSMSATRPIAEALCRLVSTLQHIEPGPSRHSTRSVSCLSCTSCQLENPLTRYLYDRARATTHIVHRTMDDDDDARVPGPLLDVATIIDPIPLPDVITVIDPVPPVHIATVVNQLFVHLSQHLRLHCGNWCCGCRRWL
jgi:hypothetical protein